MPRPKVYLPLSPWPRSLLTSRWSKWRASALFRVMPTCRLMRHVLLLALATACVQKGSQGATGNARMDELTFGWSVAYIILIMLEHISFFS